MKPSLFDRSDYPVLRDNVYFNQASLGLIGQPAATAMHGFIDDVARHGNLHMSDSDEVAYSGALRARAAKVLHSDVSRIAIVSSASEMLGQLPLLLQPKSGTVILAVSSDFPAVTRPWLRQAALKDYDIRFVQDIPAQDLTRTLIDAIDERVSVVAVSNVQYATGTVVNIPLLREATARVGAHLIVDATQAAGALAVDTTAWEVDAVVVSGYKWLGGHGGVALAVMSPELLERIPPLPGWMGASDPFELDATSISLAADARRYTQSTMSYVSMAGLVVSLDQLLALGEDRIEAHARNLAAILVEGVGGYGWQPYRAPGDPAAAPHIVSLVHPDVEAAAMLETLRRQNITCGARGGRIRVSIAPYNNENDVRLLIEQAARATG